MLANRKTLKTLTFTFFALIAFAANSVLSRLALGTHSIDAASYTVIRLLSGIAALSVISKIGNKRKFSSTKGNWVSSIMLFLYAVAFSFAYVTLDTGTGSLILFGAVQTTMILLSILSGNRLHILEWSGVFIAFAGFVYLVLPGVSTPSYLGFLLMTISGIGWGVYTLKGRNSESPLTDTTFNFIRTTPLILVLLIFTISQAHYSLEGVLYAVLSGAVTSGIGYTIWYIALGGLSATQAAVVQLSVPIIAALGGVIFISETITLRLALSALMILGGILLVVLGRSVLVKPKLTMTRK